MPDAGLIPAPEGGWHGASQGQKQQTCSGAAAELGFVHAGSLACLDASRGILKHQAALWRGLGLKKAGSLQEDVGCRFAILNLVSYKSADIHEDVLLEQKLSGVKAGCLSCFTCLSQCD